MADVEYLRDALHKGAVSREQFDNQMERRTKMSFLAWLLQIIGGTDE